MLNWLVQRQNNLQFWIEYFHKCKESDFVIDGETVRMLDALTIPRNELTAKLDFLRNGGTFVAQKEHERVRCFPCVSKSSFVSFTTRFLA